MAAGHRHDGAQPRPDGGEGLCVCLCVWERQPPFHPDIAYALHRLIYHGLVASLPQLCNQLAATLPVSGVC